MLLSKSVKVKVTSNVCKYYSNLGYKFKCNEIIEVKIEDLPKQSNYLVDVSCDNCGKEYKIEYYLYSKRGPKIYCKDCKHIKAKNTNLKKYGCENPFQNEEIREKQKNTIREKYRCENVFQNKEIKEKIKNTWINRIGVEHPMKDKNFSENVLRKTQESKYIHNSQICSKQQKYIGELLGGEINKLFYNLWLDVYFKEFNIYLEYNGSGHDISVKYNKISETEFINKEIKRYHFLKSKGLKQIVIESKNDKIPCNNTLLAMKYFAFDLLLNNNDLFWVVFDIDNNKIRYKNNILDYQF